MSRVVDVARRAVRAIAAPEVAAIAIRVVLGSALLWLWDNGLGAAVWADVQDREVFVRLIGAVGTAWLAIIVALRVLALSASAGVREAALGRTPWRVGAAFAPVEERKRRARHEAAHTVAALALGATVRSVDIHTRDNSTGGVTESAIPTTLSYGDRQWLRLVIAVAPYTADIDAERDLSTAGTELDLADARMRALTLLSLDHHPDGVHGDFSSDGLLLAAVARARDILDAHRNELDAITAALLEHTSLDSAAVDELWPHHLAPVTDDGGVRVSVHHTQGEDR